jgi:hypothetical protein
MNLGTHREIHSAVEAWRGINSILLPCHLFFPDNFGDVCVLVQLTEDYTTSYIVLDFSPVFVLCALEINVYFCLSHLLYAMQPRSDPCTISYRGNVLLCLLSVDAALYQFLVSLV